jgi:hypothetical protein
MLLRPLSYAIAGLLLAVLAFLTLNPLRGLEAGHAAPGQDAALVLLLVDDACGNDFVDVPDSGAYFDFYDACLAHDECYGAGGGPSQRRACDDAFLADMQAYCNSTYSVRQAGYYHCHTTARIYYAGVRLGGWLFF